MFTYLACPYKHKREDVQDMRAKCASITAMQLVRNGTAVFSPLSQGEHMKQSYGGNPLSPSQWLEVDEAVLAHASVLAILKLPGWMQSTGIKREIRLANLTDIHIEWLNPVDFIGGSRQIFLDFLDANS